MQLVLEPLADCVIGIVVDWEGVSEGLNWLNWLHGTFSRPSGWPQVIGRRSSIAEAYSATLSDYYCSVRREDFVLMCCLCNHLERTMLQQDFHSR